MSDRIAEASAPRRACSQLLLEGLPDDALHRVVLGLNGTHEAVMMSAGDLGDPFAQLVLAEGVLPATAGQVLEAIASAVPEGDALRTQRFFLVGEGSQIPEAGGADVPWNMRCDQIHQPYVGVVAARLH